MQQFKIFRALGLSFKAWFKNFIPFTLLAAILYAPVVIWLATYDLQNAEDGNSVLFGYFLGPILALWALSTLLPPLLTYRVIQDMNGKRVSILTSARFGVRGVLTAIVFDIIALALQYVPHIGSVIVIVMTCIWFVAMPASVAERIGPIAALTRSSQLTKGRRWGIFGLCLLIGLAPGILVGFWIAPLFEGAGRDPEFLTHIRSAMIVVVITTSVTHLFNGVVQAVSYVLLREDKDGVTAQELAKIFE